MIQKQVDEIVVQMEVVVVIFDHLFDVDVDTDVDVDVDVEDLELN